MSYKTIFVQVDDSRSLDSRIGLAADIAATDNAHLVGVVLTGISKFLHDTLPTVRNDPNIDPDLLDLQRRADGERKKFEEIVRRAGVASFETQIVDDEIAGGVSMLARCCDLVVLGQPDPGKAASLLNATFAEHMLTNSGVPGLVVPHKETAWTLGHSALIGWNASVEAARAVRNAIPLLQRTGNVKVAIFNAASHRELYGDSPGADIARYLARHDIDVDILTPTTTDNIGQALLMFAATQAADYLVMGCYGRSRLREVFLGGITSAVMTSMTIPVLMSH